jgi:hypothetical protein
MKGHQFRVSVLDTVDVELAAPVIPTEASLSTAQFGFRVQLNLTRQ